MTEKRTVNKINKGIAPVLESFLAEEVYQEKFKDMAFALGYKGNDISKIKEILFSADENGDIGFVLSELNEMFFEYQLTRELLKRLPFSEVLKKFPERKQAMINIAIKILNKEEIDNKEMERILKTD